MTNWEKEDYLRVENKVAIVTGAGSQTSGIGNGRAAAVLLANAGVKVILLDINEQAVQETCEKINEKNGEADCMRIDVSKPAECEKAVHYAYEKWGRLDILVNNVGVGGPIGTAIEVDNDAWSRALTINVSSMMYMSKYSLPLMARQKSGVIVNIASVAGLIDGHPSLLYPTSKGAVVNMTRAMAAQHGPDGIRVNCIAPGMVYTPMVSSRGMSQEIRELRRKRSLLQIEGNGWDVGNAVLFLASEAARWITGVVLPVDAGATAGSILYSKTQIEEYFAVNRMGKVI